MANIYVTKDDTSLYLTALLEDGDQVHFDWTLSKSYALILAAGALDINSTQSHQSICVYKVEAGEQVSTTATGQSMFVCPFLLSDDTTMNELLPTTSTLTSLRASTSHLIPTTDMTITECSETLDFDSASGNKTFTLDDLDAAVLGGLSI